MSEKKPLLKIEKIISCEKRILPYLSKFQEYFKMAIEERDRAQHQTYNLKVEFLDCRFYVECDEVGSELRMAVRCGEREVEEGEKLMNELVFIFGK